MTGGAEPWTSNGVTMPEDYVVRQTPAELAGVVRAAHGYDLSGFAPGTHLGLPSSSVTFIIALDAGGQMPRSDRSPGRSTAREAGLHDAPP